MSNDPNDPNRKKPPGFWPTFGLVVLSVVGVFALGAVLLLGMVAYACSK